MQLTDRQKTILEFGAMDLDFFNSMSPKEQAEHLDYYEQSFEDCKEHRECIQKKVAQAIEKMSEALDLLDDVNSTYTSDYGADIRQIQQLKNIVSEINSQIEYSEQNGEDFAQYQNI